MSNIYIAVQPTPYPDINLALNQVLSNMQTILGEQLIALYLGGSLALGDFDPQRSDIDFVAVTADELPPQTIDALAEMHRRLWQTEAKWAKKLDGSYVPRQIIRRWSSDHPPCPFVEGDKFYVTNQGSAVIQRHIIRQYGVVVAGPSPYTLIDPVDADELQTVLWDMLEKWWRPLLNDPDWLQQSQKQPFAVLTMCRALYTLAHGVVASKPVAARWGQQTLGEEWTELIDWALTWPHESESNHLAATINLIDYTLEQFKKHHNEQV
jgi:predicted nucleotidyltransferase